MHDFLFSTSNIAASKDHPLKLAILRHKARLSSEFTKARLRRKCATILQLKVLLAGDRSTSTLLQPRWARVNNLKSGGLESFASYTQQPVLYSLMTTYTGKLEYHVDKHIPDLLALPPGTNFTKTSQYTQGQVILQDKASCFPAYLLLGEDDEEIGDLMDACAAPGNKTTHLASLLLAGQRTTSRRGQQHIFACERDPRRSEVLQKMVNIAGADDTVNVLPRQDFFALDPNEERFANVTHFLLDPTCSGSGIVGREDIPRFKLPENPKDVRKKSPTTKVHADTETTSKKRKRGDEETDPVLVDEMEQEEVPKVVDQARHEKLSNLQVRIVERAMSFPAARRITYSTCSTHPMENEGVVSRVLVSDVARQRGWRLLRQEEQVKGMREWRHRGVEQGLVGDGDEPVYGEAERLACVRCYPGTEDGTMGFFVCCFVRDAPVPANVAGNTSEDEFAGFDD